MVRFAHLKLHLGITLLNYLGIATLHLEIMLSFIFSLFVIFWPKHTESSGLPIIFLAILKKNIQLSMKTGW